MKRHTQPIDRLIVHHSASPRSTTLKDIRRWHVDERGWEDVGYHFVIDGFGDHLLVRTPDWREGEPSILVLSHMVTVHPIGTIECDNPVRREGDRARELSPALKWQRPAG